MWPALPPLLPLETASNPTWKSTAHKRYLVSPTKKNPLIYSNNETRYTKVNRAVSTWDTGTPWLRKPGHKQWLDFSQTDHIWDLFATIPNATLNQSRFLGRMEGNGRPTHTHILKLKFLDLSRCHLTFRGSGLKWVKSQHPDSPLAGSPQIKCKGQAPAMAKSITSLDGALCPMWNGLYYNLGSLCTFIQRTFAPRLGSPMRLYNKCDEFLKHFLSHPSRFRFLPPSFLFSFLFLLVFLHYVHCCACRWIHQLTEAICQAVSEEPLVLSVRDAFLHFCSQQEVPGEDFLAGICLGSFCREQPPFEERDSGQVAHLNLRMLSPWCWKPLGELLLCPYQGCREWTGRTTVAHGKEGSRSRDR